MVVREWLMRSTLMVLMALVLVATGIAAAAEVAVPAAQFTTGPSTDVAALQRRVEDLRARLDRTRTSASDRAETARLETELTEIADDVAYLRVRARRGETVSERDRRDISDRLTRLESRIAGVSSASASPSVIPVGTEIDLRLQTPLSSKDAKVEQRVDATTAVDLLRQDRVVVPAGSAVRGYVVSVDPASRLDRRGSLVVKFTHLTVEGRTHDVTLSITQALESEGIRGEAERIGIGAGVGAILNGVKGAIAGILIGSGGVVLATEGKDVELPVGTILRVRFDSPLDLAR
jgi:hypothetical protein